MPAGIPFKISNVSYTNNKTVKTLYVPYIEDEFKFGTGMTDPVWKKVSYAGDFAPFRKKTVDKASEFAVFRTREHLVIGFFFYEDTGKIKYQKSASASCWSGDVAELHFGAMEPDPWLWQLAIGVKGNRFDSSGNLSHWKAETFVNDKGWGAEVMIKNSMLKLSEGGFRFNICRIASERCEFSCWSKVHIRFHEVENYGELIYFDYKDVFMMRFGQMREGQMTREEYEKLAAAYRVDACKVIHGPYVSGIDKDSASVSWATAGKVPSYIKYREKGSSDVPKIAASGKKHGIMAHNTEHFVCLNGLEAGKEYEYEIFVLTPVLLREKSSKIRRFFRIPAAHEQNFSFVVSNDIHSEVKFLRSVCKTPSAQKAAFHIVNGDLLSHAAGPSALYSGIIDPMVAVEHKNPYDRPLLFVRGNHEQLGVYASDFFRIFRRTDGRTYYSFCYGDVYFIVLDTGNDRLDSKRSIFFSNTELMTEQHEFLKEVASDVNYRNAKYRIVFQHIPPLSKRYRFYAQFHNMLAPLIDSGLPPDVVICGHTHRYIRQDAGSAKFSETSDKIWLQKKFPVTPVPYNLIINGSEMMLDCNVSPASLDIRVMRPIGGGKSEKILDVISIKPEK